MALQDAHENMGRFYYFFNLFVFFLFLGSPGVTAGIRHPYEILFSFNFMYWQCIGQYISWILGPNFRCFLNLFFYRFFCFYFLHWAIHLLYWGVQISVYNIYIHIFLMFFAFGNTFVFLVVQISGYVLIFSNFLHRAIHLLYIGGSKFHDIYFVCIGQYICGIGGSKFHDIFF